MLTQNDESVQYSDSYCPCCGEQIAIHAIQTYPAKYNLPDRIEVHCINRDCGIYMRTTNNIEEAYEDYLEEIRKLKILHDREFNHQNS